MSHFLSMCAKLERGARNGQRVHLTIDEVRAFIESDAYPLLMEAARQELIATWRSPTMRDQQE